MVKKRKEGERERERERQTDRQTDRQRQRERESREEKEGTIKKAREKKDSLRKISIDKSNGWFFVKESC